LIQFNHVCSPQSLISILKNGQFNLHQDSIHGGIGIYGFIEGYPVCPNQSIVGRGAELVIKWEGDFIDLGTKPLPISLNPNSIYRQGASRSIIPALPSLTSIKVIDFTIHDFALRKIGIRDRVRLHRLRSKLSKNPILVNVAA
tara:strand:+ start:187 stop:615 length:429 start_codon:yes stop_codon:yes gene_type:complete